MAAIQRLADLSLLVFAVSSMLAIGMSERPADVIAATSKPLPIVLALLVNFVLAPLLAVALTRLIPLQPAHATGLLLLGTAAGAPFLPKLAEIAHGNLAYSLALMVLLMAASIVLMPLMLPLILPGLAADPWSIAKPLIVVLVVPLMLGFALGGLDAKRLGPLLALARKVANGSFVLLLVLLIVLDLGAILGMFGSFVLATYSAFVLAMVGLGYAVGAIDRPTQSVFALCAGNRNIAAALVVAETSLNDSAVTVMLLAASLVGLGLLLGLARVMRPGHSRA
jgi:BASS family bile acid:Na+ symporter